MRNIRLGSTGIVVPQNAFGALPVQRTETDEAVRILRRAYEGGMRYIDTARAYTDSEEKLGRAFDDDWPDDLYIATKTMAKTPEGFWRDLNTSLEMLRRPYVDVYQFHMANVVWKPGDGTGMYECMLEAKDKGLIKHIGITAHKIGIAEEAVESGLYETLQFPFSYLAGERELALVDMCQRHDVGYIAMKGLAGGLINNGYLAAAFMQEQDIVLPIWGVQRESELDEFIDCLKNGRIAGNNHIFSQFSHLLG